MATCPTGEATHRIIRSIVDRHPLADGNVDEAVRQHLPFPLDLDVNRLGPGVGDERRKARSVRLRPERGLESPVVAPVRALGGLRRRARIWNAFAVRAPLFRAARREDLALAVDHAGEIVGARRAGGAPAAVEVEAELGAVPGAAAVAATAAARVGTSRPGRWMGVDRIAASAHHSSENDDGERRREAQTCVGWNKICPRFPLFGEKCSIAFQRPGSPDVGTRLGGQLSWALDGFVIRASGGGGAGPLRRAGRRRRNQRWCYQRCRRFGSRSRRPRQSGCRPLRRGPERGAACARRGRGAR